MEGAILDTLRVGETKTYSVHGFDYEVNLISILGNKPSNITAQLSVNDEQTKPLKENQIHILGNGTSIGIKSILLNRSRKSGHDLVEFYLGVSNDSRIEINKSMSPLQFLCFARDDLQQGDARGIINAYSNLKRAMHCQIDILLNYFGLLGKNKISKMNFPQKFDHIKKLGFVSPDSFNQLNESRNLLEHDYIFPDKKEIIFGLDTVELFIVNTNKILLDKIEFSDKWKKRLGDISETGLPDYLPEEVSVEHRGIQSSNENLDLKNYPWMFVDDEGFHGLLVVGDKAPAEHVISVSDIAMSLQFAFRSKENPDNVTKIGVGATVLSSEVELLNTNIISVGNPDINPVTAKIMGVERGTILKFPDNTGMIKMYELEDNNVALVVLGDNDQMIRVAATVLSNFREYALSGSSMVVKKG